jgi:hypothetical protein
MLTKEERIAALERVREDQGGTENKVLKKHQIKEALLDIRTWLVILTTLLSKYGISWVCTWTVDNGHSASVPNGGISNCMSKIFIATFNTIRRVFSQQYYHQEFWIYVSSYIYRKKIANDKTSIEQSRPLSYRLREARLRRV